MPKQEFWKMSLLFVWRCFYFIQHSTESETYRALSIVQARNLSDRQKLTRSYRGHTDVQTWQNSFKRWIGHCKLDCIVRRSDSIVTIPTNTFNSKDWLKMDHGRFMHWLYGLYCLQFLSRILHTHTSRSDSRMCCWNTLECKGSIHHSFRTRICKNNK